MIYIVTIVQVAKKSGYSVATVSLVLNNKPNRISEGAKQKILQVAKDLNYQPNHIAVSMKTKRTLSLGLIVPDISNPFFAELAKKTEEYSAEKGYSVLYSNTNDNHKSDYDHVQTFINRGVDGIIMIPSTTAKQADNERLNALIEEHHIPCVFLDRMFENPYIKTITIDHVEGGYLATKYLLENGHTNIGCICGPKISNTTKQRLEGYKKALKEFKVKFNKNLIYYGDYRSASGENAIDTLLNHSITAVFVQNDLMAVGVYKRCQHLQISIPNQLSIMGFDNTFLCEITHPPMNSIDQNIDLLAKNSVYELIKMINNPNQSNVEPIIIPAKIKVRSSVKKIEENKRS